MPRAPIREVENVHRRLFLKSASALVLACSAWSVRAAHRWRIGFLAAGGAKDEASVLEEFGQGLHARGYVDGQNLVIESRYAEGRLETLPGMAEDLGSLRVDVSFASSTLAGRAAQRATKSIPIVFTNVSDPVGSGLVESLPRPGGNVTGTMDQGVDVTSKRLDVLKQAVPPLKRLAALGYPADPLWEPTWQEAQTAARRLRIDIVAIPVAMPDEIDLELAKIGSRVDALFVAPQVFFWIHRRRIIEWAKQAKLPAVYELRDYVLDGGLMSYGPVLPALYRNAARQVDAILKGTRPADIPVEQPTKFELVVNLGTAKAIGLTIASEFLLRVDEAIQ